ncbi:hypothetical protein V6N11_009099 [Hibiscus sabdariffa]|uniref:Uncharacterized protein n=1 Tax=Hibiscus sabdariffa TaxID=183260 RepID=A0ABR2PPL9_9ROSI
MTTSRAWNVPLLLHIFPPTVAHHIFSIRCPEPNDREDFCRWRWGPDFSIKDAYERTVATRHSNSIIDVTLSLSLIRLEGFLFHKFSHFDSNSFKSLQAHLEKGDKVIMPVSALHRLAYLRVEYPMLFELTNAPAGRVSHCGVLEFVADEGMIYIPYWMMQNMHLEEGDLVLVKSASLPKATYVKLQPHTTDFLEYISNPKAVLAVFLTPLETTLRSSSCLTAGDTIMVPCNNKNYYINIVETKPSPAVSIIETDCEVDFAPPLDYKETEAGSFSTIKQEA